MTLEQYKRAIELERLMSDYRSKANRLIKAKSWAQKCKDTNQTIDLYTKESFYDSTKFEVSFDNIMKMFDTEINMYLSMIEDCKKEFESL